MLLWAFRLLLNLKVTNQIELLFQKKTDDGLIEVWNDNQLRWLSIDGIEQSRINIKRADQLTASVHRTFLASLLFTQTPEKVLLGGLGSGAVARFFYNKNPEIQGDAVEISETIASLARDYFAFPERQWNIVISDLRHWLGKQYDMMIIDIAEGDLTPAWLTSEVMLQNFKRQLSDSGVLVINLLVADASSFTQALAMVRKVFERKTLCLGVPEHKNIIVFAFNQPPSNVSLADLQLRAEKLTRLWGFDFSPFLAQLEKDNPENNGIFRSG